MMTDNDHFWRVGQTPPEGVEPASPAKVRRTDGCPRPLDDEGRDALPTARPTGFEPVTARSKGKSPAGYSIQLSYGRETV